MSHVFPRNSNSPPPMVSHGKGPYLTDAAGKTYLNCGDAAVSCLGHGDPHVTAAIKDQLDQVAFAHTGYFTSDPPSVWRKSLFRLRLKAWIACISYPVDPRRWRQR